MPKLSFGLFIKFITIFLFYSSVSFAHPNSYKLKEPGVIHVASYSKFKPVSYGNGQGYEADLLKAIAEFWQVKIKFHPTDRFQGLWLIPSTKNSKVDIAIGGMTPLNSRVKEGARFTQSTTEFSQSLLIRRNDYESGRITSYASFKNPALKIGVVPGTTGEKYAYLQAKENHLPSTVIVQYPSESALLPALKKGTIAAIARGSLGNEFQATQNHSFISIAKRSFNEHFSFAVDASNDNLTEQFNRAIDHVTHHGTITYANWLKNHNVFLDHLKK